MDDTQQDRFPSVPYLTPVDAEAVRQALGRLLAIAARDTGQSRRVADFLLAWHNAEENGGWDPTDFWSVDGAIAENRRYPDDLGFGTEIDRVWALWRAHREPNAGHESGRRERESGGGRRPA